MNSLHIISSLMPAGGGPSYTVPRLAESLIHMGNHAEIATLEAPDVTSFSSVPVRVYPRDNLRIAKLKKLGRSRMMARGLFECNCDLLHIHGLWMMPNIYPANLARKSEKPLLLAPRGMLGKDALKYSRLAKWAFWRLWQARATSQVACFHATSESELLDIRSFGLKAPVAIVRNGVDLPDIGAGASDRIAPFILALGRLHPKKGLDNLVAAFSCVASSFPDWRLKIVGFDQGGYAEFLKDLTISLGISDRVSIAEAVVGGQKNELMRDAALFALPSLNENFAVTVAESLSVGTPVIASKGAPWARLEEIGCGWWIDHGVAPLADCLRVAMSLSPYDRAEMGRRGEIWMRNEFRWQDVAKEMAGVYEWLLGGGARPACVSL